MWGESIVGFGARPLVYADGHTEDWPAVAFAPRKTNLVLYLMDGFEAHADALARLGPHKTGRACLYVARLARLDESVLRELVRDSYATQTPGAARCPASATRSRPRSGPALFALGQDGYALRTADALVLIDPWLSTLLERSGGITRPVPPALRPEEVEAVDLVCVTHPHDDHLDPETLAAIAAQRPGARFVAPAPDVHTVAAAGVPDERITGVRARRGRRGRRRPGHRRGRGAPAGSRLVRRLRLLARRIRRAARARLPRRGGRPADLPRGRHGLVARPGARDPRPRAGLAILPINGRDPLREARTSGATCSPRRPRCSPPRPGSAPSCRATSTASRATSATRNFRARARVPRPARDRARAASGRSARPAGAMTPARRAPPPPRRWRPRRRSTTSATVAARRSCCCRASAWTGRPGRPVLDRLTPERDVWASTCRASAGRPRSPTGRGASTRWPTQSGLPRRVRPRAPARRRQLARGRRRARARAARPRRLGHRALPRRLRHVAEGSFAGSPCARPTRSRHGSRRAPGLLRRPRLRRLLLRPALRARRAAHARRGVRAHVRAARRHRLRSRARGDGGLPLPRPAARRRRRSPGARATRCCCRPRPSTPAASCPRPGTCGCAAAGTCR